MQVKIPKKLIAIVVIFLLGTGFIAISGSKSPNSIAPTNNATDVNVIKVKAGYRPAELILQANKETTIRFETNNTYDCSASLLIPELKIDTFLPPNGNTDITIPAQPSGKIIYAGCSMGMYGFKMKFL